MEIVIYSLLGFCFICLIFTCISAVKDIKEKRNKVTSNTLIEPIKQESTFHTSPPSQIIKEGYDSKPKPLIDKTLILPPPATKPKKYKSGYAKIKK